MDTKPEPIYEFGGFRLDPGQKLLFGPEGRIALDRKALEVLEVLVKNRGKLVTKQQLRDQVWGGTHVGEDNITTHVSKIRRALVGDERKQAEYIETVHGEGYRFLAPVTERIAETSANRSAFMRKILILGSVLLILCLAAVWMSTSNRTHLSSNSPADRVKPDAKARYELALKYESTGEDEQALMALDEAIKIDHDFVDAYLQAALVSDQIGEEEKSLSYINGAKKCSGIQDEHNRLQVEALETRITKSNREAVTKYQLLVDSFPADVSALSNLADVAMESRRGFGEAANALERCLQIEPQNRDCNFDRLMLYVLNNDFDKATALHESLKQIVQYPWFDMPYGLALYGSGEREKARKVFQNFSHPPRHGLSRFSSGKEWLADIDLFEGRVADARASLQLLLPSDTQDRRSDRYLYLAKVESLLSNRSSARGLALKAVSEVRTRGTRAEAAVVLACSGFSPEAEKVLSSADGPAIKDLEPETRSLIDGCESLYRGGDSRAVKELAYSYELADDLDTEFFLGQAYIANGQWQLAIDVFKDLEASKGSIIASQNYPPLIWALAHYCLGLAYDKMGHREEAIQYYSRFLELWAQGDGGLKQVSYAKTRLLALKPAR